MQPRNRLTPREVQVATSVWEGLTNREIAQSIGTTEQVIKNYLRVVFDKLGVWSRLELALYIANHGGVNWRDNLMSEIAAERHTQAVSNSRADVAHSVYR